MVNCFAVYPHSQLLQLQGSRAPPLLLLFTSPFSAVWNMIVQTAGYIDSAAFNAPYLFYPELSSILYVAFLFTMPILFNSFLVSAQKKF